MKNGKRECFLFQILGFLRGRGVQESVIEEFEKQKVNYTRVALLVFSRLPRTRTLGNSNLLSLQVTFSTILPSITRTPDDSNIFQFLLLPGFAFPSWVPCADILVRACAEVAFNVDHEGHRVFT